MLISSSLPKIRVYSHSKKEFDYCVCVRCQHWEMISMVIKFSHSTLNRAHSIFKDENLSVSSVETQCSRIHDW